jgi:hypothetical protein
MPEGADRRRARGVANDAIATFGDEVEVVAD